MSESPFEVESLVVVTFPGNGMESLIKGSKSKVKESKLFGSHVIGLTAIGYPYAQEGRNFSVL